MQAALEAQMQTRLRVRMQVVGIRMLQQQMMRRVETRARMGLQMWFGAMKAEVGGNTAIGMCMRAHGNTHSPLAKPEVA